MLRFLLHRVLVAILLVWLVASATFFAVHLAPGDVASLYLDPRVPASQIERVRTLYGLDRPLPVQYLSWLGSVARADFGVSPSHQQPVLEVLRDHAGPTLVLGAAAWLLSIVAGLAAALGVAALQERLRARAAQRSATEGERSDGQRRARRLLSAARTLRRSLRAGALIVYSLPSFWIGLMAILLFGSRLGWLPISGMSDDASRDLGWAGRTVDLAEHLVLPAIILALPIAAYIAQVVHSALEEELRGDAVRAARARGHGDGRVLLHALMSSSGAALQIAGLWLRVLLGGAVVVEYVFGWPGLGRITAAAIQARDVPLVAATALVAAFAVVLGTLAADLAHALIDPRVREQIWSLRPTSETTAARSS
ncbi:MAG: ABC transporter permease [Acidobacteria bacterium]|nr:MAG: ABC transporter permease [Acidobacteriota bacterium]REK10330.1 MAG: ABC transporter permease [Acidobacteriota bacterium]